MHKEFLSYHDDSTLLEGFLACPEKSGRYPLVLVSHAWAGRDEFACKKAESLAELGYAGFALDMYGKGKLGRSIEENSALMQPFMDDRNYLLRRIKAGLHFAKTLPQIDSKKMGGIGFCFGGLCILDLARSGEPLQGIVSFHGLLNRPEKMPSPSIQAKILAMHGYADPMGPVSEVNEFQLEMEKSGADWQMHIYGNTQHAFTNPNANDANLGLIYNPLAEQRSWQAMKNFFQEIFK